MINTDKKYRASRCVIGDISQPDRTSRCDILTDRALFEYVLAIHRLQSSDNLYYLEVKVGIPLSSLTTSHVHVCPYRGPGFRSI